MSTFEDRLVNHLVSKLSLSQKEVRCAINSFGIPVAKKGNEQITGRDSLVQHKCERPPRGKTSPCGKPAANELAFPDGSIHWYCGTINKGCIKSMLSELDKEKNAKVAEAIAEETEKMKRKPKKKNPEKEVLKILNTHRIVPSKKHQFKKLNTKHGPLWIHPTKRILCYQKHHSNRKEDTFAEAYGTLETDETIRPLNHEEKEWLEKQRIPISEAAVTKPKKPPQEKKQKTPKVKKTSQKKKTPKKPKEEDTPEEKEEEDNTPEEKEEEDNTPEEKEEEDTPKDNSSEEEEDIEFNLTEW